MFQHCHQWIIARSCLACWRHGSFLALDHTVCIRRCSSFSREVMVSSGLASRYFFFSDRWQQRVLHTKRSRLSALCMEAYQSLRYYDPSAASMAILALACLHEPPPTRRLLLVSLTPAFSEYTARELVALFEGLSKLGVSHRMLTAHILKLFLRALEQGIQGRNDEHATLSDCSPVDRNADTTFSTVASMTIVLQRHHTQRTLRAFLFGVDMVLVKMNIQHTRASKLAKEGLNGGVGLSLHVLWPQNVFRLQRHCTELMLLLEAYFGTGIVHDARQLPRYLCVSLEASVSWLSLTRAMRAVQLLWPSTRVDDSITCQITSWVAGRGQHATNQSDNFLSLLLALAHQVMAELRKSPQPEEALRAMDAQDQALALRCQVLIELLTLRNFSSLSAPESCVFASSIQESHNICAICPKVFYQLAEEHLLYIALIAGEQNVDCSNKAGTDSESRNSCRHCRVCSDNREELTSRPFWEYYLLSAVHSLRHETAAAAASGVTAESSSASTYLGYLHLLHGLLLLICQVCAEGMKVVRVHSVAHLLKQTSTILTFLTKSAADVSAKEVSSAVFVMEAEKRVLLVCIELLLLTDAEQYNGYAGSRVHIHNREGVLSLLSRRCAGNTGAEVIFTEWSNRLVSFSSLAIARWVAALSDVAATRTGEQSVSVEIALRGGQIREPSLCRLRRSLYVCDSRMVLDWQLLLCAHALYSQKVPEHHHCSDVRLGEVVTAGTLSIVLQRLVFIFGQCVLLAPKSSLYRQPRQRQERRIMAWSVVVRVVRLLNAFCEQLNNGCGSVDGHNSSSSAAENKREILYKQWILDLTPPPVMSRVLSFVTTAIDEVGPTLALLQQSPLPSSVASTTISAGNDTSTLHIALMLLECLYPMREAGTHFRLDRFPCEQLMSSEMLPLAEALLRSVVRWHPLMRAVKTIGVDAMQKNRYPPMSSSSSHSSLCKSMVQLDSVVSRDTHTMRCDDDGISLFPPNEGGFYPATASSSSLARCGPNQLAGDWNSDQEAASVSPNEGFLFPRSTQQYPSYRKGGRILSRSEQQRLLLRSNAKADSSLTISLPTSSPSLSSIALNAVRTKEETVLDPLRWATLPCATNEGVCGILFYAVTRLRRPYWEDHTLCEDGPVTSELDQLWRRCDGTNSITNNSSPLHPTTTRQTKSSTVDDEVMGAVFERLYGCGTAASRKETFLSKPYRLYHSVPAVKELLRLEAVLVGCLRTRTERFPSYASPPTLVSTAHVGDATQTAVAAYHCTEDGRVASHYGNHLALVTDSPDIYRGADGACVSPFTTLSVSLLYTLRARCVCAMLMALEHYYGHQGGFDAVSSAEDPVCPHDDSSHLPQNAAPMPVPELISRIIAFLLETRHGGSLLLQDKGSSNSRETSVLTAIVQRRALPFMSGELVCSQRLHETTAALVGAGSTGHVRLFVLCADLLTAQVPLPRGRKATYVELARLLCLVYQDRTSSNINLTAVLVELTNGAESLWYESRLLEGSPIQKTCVFSEGSMQLLEEIVARVTEEMTAVRGVSRCHINRNACEIKREGTRDVVVVSDVDRALLRYLVALAHWFSQSSLGCTGKVKDGVADVMHEERRSFATAVVMHVLLLDLLLAYDPLALTAAVDAPKLARAARQANYHLSSLRTDIRAFITDIRNEIDESIISLLDLMYCALIPLMRLDGSNGDY